MGERFVVVYEAPADFETATELADRVLVELVGPGDWLEADLLPSVREWVEEAEGGPLTWKRVAELARAAGVRLAGHFDGRPGEPDAKAARRALAYVRLRLGDVAAAVLVRDADHQGERRIGLEQARNGHTGSFPVVIGLAVIERESWVVSGFDPRDEAEEQALADERQNLGFDPREQSHQLTAGKDDTAKRSPKRVLRELCKNDRNRERACWRETPLPTLEGRDRGNGLGAYMHEVRTVLRPIITG